MKNESQSRATSKDGGSSSEKQPPAKPKSSFLMLAAAAARELSRTWETRKQPVTLESNLSNGKGGPPSVSVSGDTHKMSAFEHQATVDKGLKMKIKRKGVGVQKPDSVVVKTETNVDAKNCASSVSSCSSNGIVSDKSKHNVVNDKDKSPKQKGIHKRKEVHKGKFMDGSCGNSASSASEAMNSLSGSACPEPKEADLPNIKKENLVDPYEFNAKVEDGISVPVKKMKNEKIDMGSSPVHPSLHDVSVETCDISVATEPECLGPCEPGTSVTLEGIVWHETENGVLVINVTWRGKTYVGTLLDATKHDWAPPRFNCDSPVSDIETRTPKGRGKRGRGVATPVNERLSSVEGRNLRKNRRSSAQTFTAPASPAKSDISVSGGVKRKGRPTDLDLEKSEVPKSKRSCSTSRGTPTVESPLAGLFECPEKNCHKKYRQLSGLKYHQSKFHPENGQAVSDAQGEEDTGKDDEEEEMEQESEKETQASPVKEVSKKQQQQPKEKVIELKSDNSAATSEDRNSETIVSLKADNKETKCKSENPQTPKKMEIPKPKVEIPKPDVLTKKKETPTSIHTPCSVVSQSSVVIASSTTASTTSVVTITPTAVTTPQVYQMSTASMGCLGGVTSASTHHSGQIVQPVLSAVSTHSQAATIPITVTAITGVSSPSEITKTEAKCPDKSKVKPPNRPIVPAPSPQMIALTTNVSVTHTNLAPVSTHTQMSPSLKPIQPKPTIMGEPPINPALVSLKEKKAKQKKLKPKEKEGSGVSPPSSCSVQSVVNLSANVKHVKDPLKDEHSKYDRPAVIKSVSSPAKPVEVLNRKDITSAALDMSSHRPVTLDTSRTTAATSGVIMSQIPPKMLDSQAAKPQSTHPASLLKVHSPMSESRKTPTGSSVNDNVQSPAYSDISDANESGSPQGESPQKARDETLCNRKKEESNVPQQSTSEPSNVPPHYGMYGYYGQSPYYMGNNVNPQMVQNSPKNSNQPANKDEAKPLSTPKPNQPRPGMVGEEVKKLPSKEVPAGTSEKEDGKARPIDAQASSSLTPQKMQEYQIQHQKWVQQQMYALQTLPPHAQYQYLAQYGYALDSNYHMHMMSTDPAYRQYYERAHFDEQQKKSQPDQPSKMEGDNPKVTDTQSLPANMDVSVLRSTNDSNSAYPRNPPASATCSEKSQDLRKIHERSGDRPKSVETKDNLREKQNENHQILKENIELKSQMDNRPRYEGASPYETFRLKQEEVRRHQMFLQQKLIEQQKSEDKRKQESASKPPELRSAESVAPKTLVSKPGIDLSKPSVTDGIKKDICEKLIKEPHTKDTVSNIKIGSDSKKVEEKNKHIDKSKSLTEPPPKLRPTSSSASSSGGSTTSVSSSLPTVSSSASSVQPAYGGNAYYPYNVPNNYTQGQYEQQSLNRNVNVNPVLNYSGYPHSSPVGGYGLSSSERELEKEKCGSNIQKQLPSPAVIEPDSKPSDMSHHGSPQCYGSHKIHELQEKNRLPPSTHKSSPSSSSPFPQKTADNVSAPSSPHPSLDKLREFTNSPPTQRHVHTHTHTHFVGGFPAIYDPYNAMFASPQPATTVAAPSNTAQPYSSPPK